MMMVCGSVRETLADGLVSVLQIVFSYETDIHHFGGRIAQFEEVKPRTELRSLADRDSHLAQNSAVKSLTLHIDRHLIDAWKVLALDDAFQIYIAETSHFHPHIVVQMLLCAEDENVRLNAVTEHFLDGMLSRLSLQFAGSPEIRHISEVDADGILAKFPFQLSDSFQERGALDVTNRAAYLCDNEVIEPRFSEILDVILYLVSDMRHHLYGLSEEITMTLLVDDRLVDASRRHTVGFCGLNTSETLIVTEVEIGLHAVNSDVAFAVFVRIERAGVDVDVWVKLLDGYLIASCLQQFAYGSRDDTFA